MGFQGMKQIHMLPKINLRFSAWLMQKLDADSMRVVVSDKSSIELTEESVKLVFDLPMGSKIVSQGPAQGLALASEVMAFYGEVTNSHGQKGIHSLKAAEAYLLRPLTEELTELEIGHFQIAFAIFLVGHILAPTCKHDYVCLDFLESLVVPSQIGVFNWCRYVLKHIALAARKLQADLAKGISSINVGGCHLYLQVYYIDQLDLGLLNKPTGVYPRIPLYDYESVWKIIEHLRIDQTGEPMLSVYMAATEEKNLQAVGNEAGFNVARLDTEFGNTPRRTTLPLSLQRCQNSDVTPIRIPPFASPLECGPTQFSSFLKSRYPQHSGTKMPILLREHQARLVLHTNEF
ncbi:uncharacterized protein LOC112271881 [Brachypodium distachyon]|uniref:uncharacterized protein LOC112271881 n=1 Tax=Brachypodium distachyon TaxID=15368 RepID=UPI000D0E196C|nr:uncharacterized protein LOC112271881 [Brachypodium distachyon]|eukprot:XP_024317862.1 uncharacterized protein LOC112271881 [Brachypodium distachyon]